MPTPAAINYPGIRLNMTTTLDGVVCGASATITDPDAKACEIVARQMFEDVGFIVVEQKAKACSPKANADV